IPSVRLLLAALFLGGASSLATVAVAGLLAKHWSSQTAKTVLRLSFLSLLLFLAVLYRFMPEQWRSTVEQNLTSSGLIHFAIWAASILTVAGVAITSWILRPAKT
ncbi:MAG: hypothetical protein JO022_12340, partial [Acidobacteriaceae bacterium]|nr:hypothetical protein [Acidobacteriaceae bacterium]